METENKSDPEASLGVILSPELEEEATKGYIEPEHLVSLGVFYILNLDSESTLSALQREKIALFAKIWNGFEQLDQDAQMILIIRGSFRSNKKLNYITTHRSILVSIDHQFPELTKELLAFCTAVGNGDKLLPKLSANLQTVLSTIRSQIAKLPPLIWTCTNMKGSPHLELTEALQALKLRLEQ